MSELELDRAADHNPYATSVALCKWGDLWPSASALFAEQRAEIINEFPEVPYQLDDALARQYEALGVLQCVAAHHGSAAIGYCIFYVSPSIESRGILVGSQGPWFVTKEWRRSWVGISMWKAMMKQLRSLGVRQVLAHRHENSSERLDKFFWAQGARPYARVWAMALKGEGE